MSLETRVTALATAIGLDVKLLIGDVGPMNTLAGSVNQGSLVAAINDLAGYIGNLSTLSTTSKTSLVSAINEVLSSVNAASSIDDASTATSSTWSSAKIAADLSAAISNLATGAPATLDTINEIAAALEDNPDVLAALRTLITANQTAITTLAANVGNTDADLVAAYNTAKSV